MGTPALAGELATPRSAATAFRGVGSTYQSEKGAPAKDAGSVSQLPERPGPAPAGDPWLMAFPVIRRQRSGRVIVLACPIRRWLGQTT